MIDPKTENTYIVKGIKANAIGVFADNGWFPLNFRVLAR